MFNRLRNLFRSERLAKDIREELEFHRSQTDGHFGNTTGIAEQAREASMVVWLETFGQDLRYGVRQLRKSPLLVTVAVLSLALGIGANTAIYTLIDAVMMQSLPVREPARLVLFYDGIATGVYSGDSPAQDIFSAPSAEYIRAHNGVFENLCSFRPEVDRTNMRLAGTAESAPLERVQTHLVSGNYFETLGVPATTGRMLRDADDRVEAAPAAVVSYHFWKTRFRMDRKAIGTTVTLNGSAFAVVGVTPPEFFGERIERPPDFWVPLSFQPQILRRESWLKDRNVSWLNMMGRLRPGVKRAQAQAAMTVELQQYYRDGMGTKPNKELLKKIAALRPTLKPGGSGISGLRFRYSEPLHVLMAAVGLVLLIACANIATLLMARDAARRPEFLARLALGASRGRLLRQILTESVLLSSLGGVVGAGVAYLSVRFLMTSLHVTDLVKVRPNGTVLAFAIAVTLLTGVLFGLLPALRTSRIDLRPGNAAITSRHRFTSARVLIALQVALSLTLLASAGLLLHSLAALSGQQLGFQKEQLLVVQTDPRLAGYEKNKLLALYRELHDRLGRLPGAQSATFARYTPVSGNKSTSNFSMEGYTPSSKRAMDVNTDQIAPRFFETLKLPILLGRAIDERDTPASESVVVVNQMFVKTHLNGANPIGRRIMLGSPFAPPGAKIIGVAGDAKFFDLQDNIAPMAFFALWQASKSDEFVFARDLVIRTTQPPLALAEQVRQMLKSIDSRLPVLRVTTLKAQVDGSLDQQRLLAALCTIFAVLALALAAVGIYGTLAYSVARRKPEIGIRMAIGAQRRHVLWAVLRESVLLVCLGLVAGLPLAYLAGTGVRSFLYGVSPMDPLAAGAAIAAILMLSLVAAYFPARRATKVDPIAALRYE